MASSTWTGNYDVFLSFRGEDTRKNFTDHLHTALVQRGINTFRDDKELNRGEEISQELLREIEKSRISIIVFSKNYASSRWCLDELSKIMECKRTLGQMVLPVFYDIGPNDVQQQTGSFAEAFAKHEKSEMAEKVQRWRSALTEAASLAKWDLGDGYEAKFIGGIVREVSTKLNKTHLDVGEYVIGIHSRVIHVISLLSLSSNGIRIIGIYGMGGIGKTTIAKAVYNCIYEEFEGSSFLEASEQQNDLLKLQKQLLSEILKEKDLIKIGNVDRGINVIKERLCKKKVLIVLDGVNNKSQVDKLVRDRRWFGNGSRIIITTRDEFFLNWVRADEKYKVQTLSLKDSMNLFSLHAFKQDHLKDGYEDLSRDVVRYAGGIPLALEVLGSFLSHKREWQDVVDKLKRIPAESIQEKLKISFDALDDNEKFIFLDIACFFIGMDKNYVSRILLGCGFFSDIGLSFLTRLSLVSINNKNELRMHDLLRDMGREIVRKECPDSPGKRSRLWDPEDVRVVLTRQKGTEEIEGLVVNFPQPEDSLWSSKAFADMSKLRLLQLNYVQLSGDFRHFSTNKLSWLCWHGFPYKSMPTSFHLENLVILDMQHSTIRKVWKEAKFLRKLEILNLSHSHYLKKTPDFLKFPNLERLILEDCISLVEIHYSIGHLEKLVSLNLRDCTSLMNLPNSLEKSKSLKQLITHGCSKLGYGITTSPAPVSGLCFLKRLFLSYCNRLESSIPADIGRLQSLQELDISFNKFCSLPDLSHLSQLNSLVLDDCNKLQSLPKLPLGLKALHADGCSSLRTLSNLEILSSLKELHLCYNRFSSLPDNITCLSQLQDLWLSYSRRLKSIPELPPRLENLCADGCELLILNNCNLEFQTPKWIEPMHADHMAAEHSDPARGRPLPCNIFLPGRDIPGWFSNQEEGCSATFMMPFDRKVRALNVCVVYVAIAGNSLRFDPAASIRISDYTTERNWTYSQRVMLPANGERHIWLCHVPHNSDWMPPITSNSRIRPATCFRSGHRYGVVVGTSNSFLVEKCAVQLVFEGDSIADKQGLLLVDDRPWAERMRVENGDRAEAPRVVNFAPYIGPIRIPVPLPIIKLVPDVITDADYNSDWLN